MAVSLDCRLQVLDAGVYAMPDSLFARSFEGLLDQIGLKLRSRGELDAAPGVIGTLAADSMGLARTVVVHDEIHFQIRWNRAIGLIKKFKDIGTALAVFELPDHVLLRNIH